ncbi:Serine/threonine-protein phosphatase PP-X-like protein 4 [Verticillium dahliae VDG1]|nr:Serine/threonine-protein phosphatase PP-X-like protein 4 [Verticillium dahliae VDG1]
MAAFRRVNTLLAAAAAQNEDEMTTSPLTPRPNTAPHAQQRPDTIPEDAATPTRASFAGNALASQKPLPSSPFPDAVQIPESADGSVPTRENSRHSRKSRDSEDVDMDDSDGDTAAGDEGVSDDDSVNGDGSRSGKKKKSQRFYCTDYPPCNLSFTRSEHLARHIRKHTGERPFQCHCSRRFSRLDNLRQHAQTVHVNEDIPMDSLAATGARFQRQIRTDRVRQAAGRSRASTAGSGGGPVRGHSKSLSTSSIGSVGSVGPAFASTQDIRRRPPPLVMADPRARSSLEGYRAADGAYGYRPASPTDFGTPTSATFSTGQSSPRWNSVMASPATSHSRSHSMYSSGARTPGRRLSVPSGANPFQSPHGTPVSRVIFAPNAVNNPNVAPFSPAGSSILGSPPTPSSAWSGRRDSTSSAADEAWRRRTWHPESRGFQPNSSSHLSNVVTPGQFQPGPPLPVANVMNPQQTVRLPGIESFDPLLPRPATPPRRNPSPMMIDAEPKGQPTHVGADDRRNWDMGLHRGLTRLDLRSNNVTPPHDSAGACANEVNQAVQAQAEQVRVNPPTVRFELGTPPTHPNTAPFNRTHHQYTMSAPMVSTPRDSKRHGWYHGPLAQQAQGELVRGPRVDRMEHPNMTAFSGFPGREPPREPPSQPQPHSQQPGGDRTAENSSRFDALVAVAASEGSTATAY